MGEPMSLKINGKVYEIGDNVGVDDRLVNFLHEKFINSPHITCYEGGCGACIVVAKVPDPVTATSQTYAVNSCLVPVLSCNGWEITTSEGLGNSYDGYHVIQDKLVELSGTQCGYCSPGFVMNMYGLTQDNPSWTASDVEKCLDANFCRCTGYRPIIEAFKSLTTKDIEDAHLASCPNTGKPCQGKCSKGNTKDKSKESGCAKQTKSLQGKTKRNASWFQPATLQELYDILAGLPAGDSYSLICGNTAQAIVGKDYSSKATIFIRNVPELLLVSQSPTEMKFGANVSISRVITEMKTMAATDGFAYLGQLADAWYYLGGSSVRNMGSWAGNLATRITHKDFPSDLFTHLVAAGATVTIGGTDGTTSTHSLEELLDIDLMADRKIILELTLLPMAADVVFRVYKVSPRSTNTHAFVNAGIRMQVDVTNAHTVVGTPVIVYGCINSTFVHATATETALADKSLEDESVVQAAIAALATEVVPYENPLDAPAEYKVALTQNILYKTILGIIGDVASEGLRSGSTEIERALSSGQQKFDVNPEIWPLGKAIPKLEAHIQCSGEADYVSTTTAQSDELFGLFVKSTQANARIVSIDPSAALEIPGVLAFVGLEDITGENNIQSFSWPTTAEPLFPEERVSYYGQPLGLVVCEGRGPAYAAAAAVKVTYDDIQPPVVTIAEALKSPLPPNQPDPVIKGDTEAGFAASAHIIEGAIDMDGQYHFGMESQICIVSPTDQGLDVVVATQWATETQRSIGKVLGIPDNRVNVTAKKVGGAFGSKIDRCNILATAAALAAQKTRRSVRVSLDFGDNMTIIGWRDPYASTYKVGVDASGVLQAVEATLTCDSGYTDVDNSAGIATMYMPSCYQCANIKLTPQFVLTNSACNTFMRCPGVVNGICLSEVIMDHVASVLGKDPTEVRRKNLMADGGKRLLSKALTRLRAAQAGVLDPIIPEEVVVPNNLISDMIDQILVSSDWDTRMLAVEDFNQKNKWKKRGMALMPEMFVYVVPSSFPMNAMVSVNARDGSVSVSHGAAELGQGANTKVAQCAAYELGIDLDMIAIRDTNSHANANSRETSGNHGSDVASFSVSLACRTLKQRLDAFKETLEDPSVDWPGLVLQAYEAGLDICERYCNTTDEAQSYNVFGVGVSEVELDVLTGQFVVLRSDILEDAGRSISPLVDIGQVEGGFVMGQGLFTTERPIYDPTTGERLTNSTWNYHPLMSQDIPVDLRVELLHDAPNPLGVQSSKITGEPPLNLAFTVIMALRQAITSARADGGNTGWFQIDTPLTVDKLQRLCLVDPSRLVITDN